MSMNSLSKTYQVVIVGGGPVGLFLAILLRQQNIDCVVLEKRTERITHSRSLGIHPVSLELMDKIGLADRFIEEGIQIKKGIAYCDNGKIGILTFDKCHGPYRFVLSLPQYLTERLLEDKLRQLDPKCLVRGAELISVDLNRNNVGHTVCMENQTYSIRSDFTVGCDGKNSVVRDKAKFSFEGRRYPDTYVMGDFSDHTKLGTTAAIFLHSEGLIESFPLTKDRRRWVVKTSRFVDNPDRGLIEKLIQQRINYDLSGTNNFMLSSFGVQKYLANPMAKNRIYLAGDAAHIVSPIGGQGMNLGWMDAWDFSKHLNAMLNDKGDISIHEKQYNADRTKVAKKVIRRAEINMKLGRKSGFPYPKNSLVWLMLNTPLEGLMANLFTMRGLQNWPI